MNRERRRGARIWIGIVLLLVGFWAGVVRFVLLLDDPDRGRFDGGELAIIILLGVGIALVGEASSHG